MIKKATYRKTFLVTLAMTMSLIEAGAQPSGANIPGMPGIVPSPDRGSAQESPGFKTWQGDARPADLWPGKQVNINGLSLDWEFLPGRQTKDVHVAEADPFVSGTVLQNSGEIVIKDTVRTICRIPMPYALEGAPMSTFHGRIGAFAKGFAFSFEPKPSHKPVKVAVNYWQQPETIQLNGLRQEGHLYVSHDSPVSVGSFSLSVSGEARPYPDGSEYYELYLSEATLNTSVTAPITRGAKTSLGRLSLEAGHFWPATKTVEVAVFAAMDYSTNGLDTVLSAPLGVAPGENLEEFLERVGRGFGFKVTWNDAEGHPGSAEISKNSKDIQSYPDGLPGNGRTLFEALRINLTGTAWTNGPAAEVTRISDGELAVRPSRKRIEAEKNMRIIAQEREEFPLLFTKDYTAETRIYPVEVRIAVTAKTLIEQELKSYVLAQKSDGEKLPANRRILHDGLQLEISAVPGISDAAEITTTTREFVVPDEKAGLLLVHAVPATHEKIKEILQKVQSLVASTETTTAAARSYRVDLVLLEGLKDAVSATSVTSGTSDPFAASPAVPAKPAPVDPKEFGLTADDLKLFGFTSVAKLGSGVVNMVVEAGSSSEASVSLSEVYNARLEVLDYRKPYIIVRGVLEGVGIPDGPNMKVTKTLLENTLYLEAGKPTLLGVTNFKQALILIVKVRE